MFSSRVEGEVGSEKKEKNGDWVHSQKPRAAFTMNEVVIGLIVHPSSSILCFVQSYLTKKYF